jgi:hypothetical protein
MADFLRVDGHSPFAAVAVLGRFKGSLVAARWRREYMPAERRIGERGGEAARPLFGREGAGVEE